MALSVHTAGTVFPLIGSGLGPALSATQAQLPSGTPVATPTPTHLHQTGNDLSSTQLTARGGKWGGQARLHFT